MFLRGAWYDLWALCPQKACFPSKWSTRIFHYRPHQTKNRSRDYKWARDCLELKVWIRTTLGYYNSRLSSSNYKIFALKVSYRQALNSARIDRPEQSTNYQIHFENWYNWALCLLKQQGSSPLWVAARGQLNWVSWPDGVHGALWCQILWTASHSSYFWLHKKPTARVCYSHFDWWIVNWLCRDRYR